MAHPLQRRWTLWCDNPKLKRKEETWEDNLKMIFNFASVEEFWAVYNNIVPPSGLAVGSNYHYFIEGVKPMWEDETNKEGGKWVLTVARGQRKKLDEWWMRAVLAVIGESIDEDGGSEVCGLVVSIRKSQDRISLWTKTATAGQLQQTIAQRLKKALELPPNQLLKFQCHNDALATGSSFKNEALYEC